MSLCDEAERAEAAADLLRGRPAEVARALVEALGSAELERATPRALWNLLWLSGELSTRVDVYRSVELLGAVERLLGRLRPDGDAERAAVAEMAFDFFFNRSVVEQPLATARLDDTLATLRRLLARDCSTSRRAALHGLGHLRQRLDGAARDRVDTAFDDFLRETDSTQLAQYAVRARTGELP